MATLKFQVELKDLDHGSVNDPKFNFTLKHVTKLMEQHIEKEETELLPKLKQVVSDEDMKQLADQFAEMKAKAPTHPHPFEPNQP